MSEMESCSDGKADLQARKIGGEMGFVFTRSIFKLIPVTFIWFRVAFGVFFFHSGQSSQKSDGHHGGIISATAR